MFIVYILLSILIGCKSHGKNECINKDKYKDCVAKLEKIGEIKLEETGNILIGIIYVFEINLKEKTILITDPMFCKLKIYSDEGKFIKEIGKKGEGPGEFGRIMGVGYDVNYYYTTDDLLRRFSVFTKDGSYIKSFPVPTSIFLSPGKIIVYNSKIYVGSKEAKYKPMDETYKSKQIAVLDTFGNILFHFGDFDEIYRKFKLMWSSTVFDMDEVGNVYITSNLTWRISKYDKDGNFIKRFGIKGSNFNEAKENMRGNETIEEIRKLALKHSEVHIIKYGANLVYQQYSNVNNNFFESRSRLDRESYLMIYSEDGEYIKSDIKLPGGGMLDVDDNGIIYIELSDEPGNRIIGKYKIRIEKEY